MRYLNITQICLKLKIILKFSDRLEIELKLEYEPIMFKNILYINY